MATTAPSSELKPLINLIRGWPNASLLPASQLSRAATTVLSDPSIFTHSLQYAPDMGYEPLRAQLAPFLASHFKVKPDIARICITGGASQNVARVLQSFSDPGYTRAVWAVAPVYHLVCPIFEDGGFKGRLRAVPEDEGGVDIGELERRLEELNAKGGWPETPPYKSPLKRKIYKHILYCVPTSSNPSSKTMSLERRTALVHLARKHDILIITDDVYDLLQWPDTTLSSTSSSPSSLPPFTSPPSPLKPFTAPLPRLIDIDLTLPPLPSDPEAFHHTLSNGSFSKLIGPGNRTGWAEASPALAAGLAMTGSTRSGGAPSQLTASIVAEMMRSGDVVKHVEETVRPALARRHGVLVGAVRRECGEWVEVEQGGRDGWAGGYFIWVRLRDGFNGDAAAVAGKALEQENLVIAEGNMFTVPGDESGVRFPRHLRLTFAWEDEEKMVEGVQRLRRVFEKWGKESGEKASGGIEGEKLGSFY